MDDPTSATFSETLKRAGLSRYLWINFLVFPLAAVSASTVTVVVVALQGLTEDDRATQLFALIAIVGFKLLAVIAASYSLATFLGLSSAFVIVGISHVLAEKIVNWSGWLHKNAQKWMTHRTVKWFIHLWGWIQKKAENKDAFPATEPKQVALIASLAIGCLLLFDMTEHFVAEDIYKTWSLLDRIANI